MLKAHRKTINYLLGTIDIFFTIISFILTYLLYTKKPINEFFYSRQYVILLLAILPTWYIFLKITNLTRIPRIKTYSSIFTEYLVAISLGLVTLFIISFLFHLDYISRGLLFLFGGINLAFLFTTKIIFYSILKYYRKKGRNISNLMIIADDSSDDVIQSIIENSFWGYKIKVIITNSKKITKKYDMCYSVLPENTNIDKFIELETIDEVIYAKNHFDQEEIKKLIYSCQEIGTLFRFRSQLFNIIASQSHFEYFGNYPMISFTNTPSSFLQLKIKGLIDFVFSLLIILFNLPLLVVVALAIKIDSHGPVVFKQTRIGLRNRRFSVYKFRTMVENAEALKPSIVNMNEQDGPVFKIKNDPRITRVGRFLRKYSLDELPQFFNVLKGEMSIVGPRPPLPEEVKEYERWHRRRLSMKPGITCIWQVSGRNDIDFDEWMKLDMQYINNWSLKLDFILILKTIRAILFGNGH